MQNTEEKPAATETNATLNTEHTPFPTQPIIGHDNLRQRTKRRKLIIIAAVAAVLIIGSIAGLALRKDTKLASTGSTPSQTTSGDRDFTVAPRFGSVNGYVSFKNAEWYAVDGGIIRIEKGKQPTYYTQREGLPRGILTSLVVYKNNLWVGAQDGVATLKADTSGFEPVPTAESISNGQLYADTYADKLYLNNFTSFYVLGDDAKTWNKVAGPSNFYSFAANKDFVAGTVNSSGMAVWVYSKATDKWALKKPSGIDNQALQTVFTIGEDLFAIGRTTGYQNCNQQGKVTASSAYHLDKDGNWQPLKDFNKDVNRLELNVARHIKDPSTVLYTSPCDTSDRTKYKAAYENDTLKLTRMGTVADASAAVLGSDGEQETLVGDLRKATGLYPFIRVLEADKKGNLVFGYASNANSSSTVGIEGIAVAKGSDFTRATAIRVENRKDYDVLVPVMCDGTLSYLFAGKYAYKMSGGYESFPNGEWATARLLKLNGDKATPFADLQANVGEPRFACAKGKVNWVGRTAVQQLDVASKKISTIGAALPQSNALQTQTVYPVANGDLWALIPVDTSKNDKKASLYHFTAGTSELKRVGTYSAVGLLGGTSTHAWVAEAYGGPSSDIYEGLAAYDTTGAKTNREGTFLRVGITGDKQAVVAQAADNPNTSIFVPFTVVNYTLGSSNVAIDASKVPAHSMRLSTDSLTASSYTNNSGVYDQTHNRMWFSDDQLGSFAVEL